jgi:plastocyanin
VLGVIAAAAAGAASALAAGETIEASTGANTFTKQNFNIDQGTLASFSNPAGTDHNVNASGKGPDGKTLFRANTIAGGTTPVNGTQYLSQGKYHFVCTIHFGMEADLTVSGNGTPVARPDIEVKLLSRNLDKVVASRRLKVQVAAETESDDIELVARKGARKLASKKGVDLAAGAKRTLKLRLTNAGRNAIDDLDAAKVKLTGSVPFGRPDSAKRTLR